MAAPITISKFNAQLSYDSGDYVLYDDIVFQFNEYKAPGVWNPSIVRNCYTQSIDAISVDPDNISVRSYSPISSMRINGQTYKIQDESIAKYFSVASSYESGEYVRNYENGRLYRFDVSHAPGAWDDDEVTEVSFPDLINGAYNFNYLQNKPSINGNVLSSSSTSNSLGITVIIKVPYGISTIDFEDVEMKVFDFIEDRLDAGDDVIITKTSNGKTIDFYLDSYTDETFFFTSATTNGEININTVSCTKRSSDEEDDVWSTDEEDGHQIIHKANNTLINNDSITKYRSDGSVIAAVDGSDYLSPSKINTINGENVSVGPSQTSSDVKTTVYLNKDSDYSIINSAVKSGKEVCLLDGNNVYKLDNINNASTNPIYRFSRTTKHSTDSTITQMLFIEVSSEDSVPRTVLTNTIYSTKIDALNNLANSHRIVIGNTLPTSAQASTYAGCIYLYATSAQP